MGPLRTAEVSMTLTFLDSRSGRLMTIKVPEEPPRQPQHPVMGALAIEPRWGSYGPEAGRVSNHKSSLLR